MINKDGLNVAEGKGKSRNSQQNLGRKKSPNDFHTFRVATEVRMIFTQQE